MAKKILKETMQDFILEFFTSFDSKITKNNNVLTISNVPADFEDFVGKKAPYNLVFDFNKHADLDDSELIVKGSYFLLAIRDYMKNKGQTCLLMSDKLKSKTYIVEFTFLSTCQYLNKKKQFINTIHVPDLSSIDLKFKEGNPADIDETDISEQYTIAQKELKKIINKETKQVRASLKAKLEKELKRVRDHYSKQIKEEDEELERCVEKIHLLESQLKHTFYERDARILQMKIRESKVRLEELKKRTYKERLEQEEKFHINDELDKHAMMIAHSLVNAKIIYSNSDKKK